MKNFYTNFFDEVNNLLNKSDISSLDKIAKALISLKKKKNKVIIFGNGGSASISSHISLINKAQNKSVNFNCPIY